MSEVRQSLESAIRARVSEQQKVAHEAAEKAARDAAQRAEVAAEHERLLREREARELPRKVIQARMVGHVRAELSALAELLIGRGVHPHRTMDVWGTKKEIHYTGLLAVLKRGPYEEREAKGVVGTRRIWVIRETTYTTSGGSGWDGEPGPYTEVATPGLALADDGNLINLAERDRPWNDSELVTLSNIDAENPSINEKVIAEWHDKIVGWGVQLLGDR